MALRSRGRPIVHLYTISWNEEFMLGHFFKHYDEFVERYVFFDDGSTDSTLEILATHPRVEIRRLPRLKVDSFVLAAQQTHNRCWKESRGLADWVIITAVDEFLYTENLQSYLAECSDQGVTAIPALGWQMISQDLPMSDRSLPESVKRGCPWPRMSKLSLFDPDEIGETNQEVGRHAARPTGNVKYPEQDVLLNLHYKFLSFERTFSRQIALWQKLGSVDKQRGFGSYVGLSRAGFEAQWDYLEQNAVEDVFSPGHRSNLERSPWSQRWWRTDRAGAARIEYWLAGLWAKLPEPVGRHVRGRRFVKIVKHLLRRLQQRAPRSDGT